MLQEESWTTWKDRPRVHCPLTTRQASRLATCRRKGCTASSWRLRFLNFRLFQKRRQRDGLESKKSKAAVDAQPRFKVAKRENLLRTCNFRYVGRRRWSWNFGFDPEPKDMSTKSWISRHGVNMSLRRKATSYTDDVTYKAPPVYLDLFKRQKHVSI